MMFVLNCVLTQQFSMQVSVLAHRSLWCLESFLLANSWTPHTISPEDNCRRDPGLFVCCSVCGNSRHCCQCGEAIWAVAVAGSKGWRDGQPRAQHCAENSEMFKLKLFCFNSLLFDIFILQRSLWEDFSFIRQCVENCKMLYTFS